MKAEVRTLFLATLIGLAMTASPLLAQPEDANCPPACTIDITVPDDVSQPPAAHPVTLTTGPGEFVNFEASGSAFIIFSEGGTPFVDNAGRPIYQFNVNRLSGRSMQIRSDSNPCQVERNGVGCKYMVVDPNNRERPPLDPFIVIRNR